MSSIQTGAVGPQAALDASKQTQSEKSSTGAYQGREVKALNSTSNAQDASEEMTFHSKLADKSKKEANDREVKSARRADKLEELMEIAEVAELLAKLGDLDQDQLEKAIRALLEHRERDPQQLRERAGQHFEEPAHQYALLKGYSEVLKQQNAPTEDIQAAEAALKQLMEADSGIDIRAALNTGEVTNEFSDGGLGDHQTLRDAYRDNIKDYQDLNATLADLSSRLPDEKLAEAIAFITTGLSADLAVEGSSIDKKQLELIISDMTWLKSSATILANCGLVVDKAQTRGAKPSFTDDNLCKKVVSMQSASTVRHEQFSEIPDDAGFDEFEDRIVLLTDLTALIRLIPQDNFPSEQRRDNFIASAQTALDKEIEAEEAEIDYDDDEEEYDE